MKKILALVLSMITLTTVFTACSSPKSADNSNIVYNVGIAQFAEHPSLDNCREGFIEGLKEEGFEEGKNITFEYKNAQADMGIANQIAQSMASGNTNLICSIATPMAQASFNYASEKDIPVIYSAVSDPVAAELANADGTPSGNTTGTSDKLPVKAQLEMIRKFMPDATKIGIIYSTSEVNSESMIKIYKELAPDYGFEIVEGGINQSADIPLVVESVLAKADCLSNLVDNTVVSNLPILLDAANNAGKPVYGSEVEQVKMGCAAAAGLDYVALGKQTGKMAAKVLNGEKASEIPYESFEAAQLYINSATLASLNMSCPEELKDFVQDMAS